MIEIINDNLATIYNKTLVLNIIIIPKYLQINKLIKIIILKLCFF